MLLTDTEAVGRCVETGLDLFPEADSLEVVAYDDVELSLLADSVDAAAIGDIVVDTHRKWAGALRNETDVATNLSDVGALGGDNVLSAEVDVAGDLDTLVSIHETVERPEESRLAAAGGADDTSNLILRNRDADILKNMCVVDIQVQVVDSESDVGRPWKLTFDGERFGQRPSRACESVSQGPAKSSCNAHSRTV